MAPVKTTASQASSVTSYNSTWINFFWGGWLCGPSRARVSPFMRVQDHTQRRIRVGRTSVDEWSASTCKHTTLTTNIHAPGGIGTHDLSRRAAADLRLGPHGHWDRLGQNVNFVFHFFVTSMHKFRFLHCPRCRNKRIFISGLNEQTSNTQLNMYIRERQKNSSNQQELSQSGVETDTRMDYKCKLPGTDGRTDGSSYQAS